MTATESQTSEHIILVDAQDRVIGYAEKLSAHKKNQLHRAFSVFIFRMVDEQPQLLLQQRGLHKYHSPGLWSNTCCSHPRPGEEIVAAGERRLKEEMNLETALSRLGWFHYNVHFDNGLSENEIDHVLIGRIAAHALPTPNAAEVNAYRWITLAQLQQELVDYPDQFTPWLQKALNVVSAHIPEIFGTTSIPPS